MRRSHGGDDLRGGDSWQGGDVLWVFSITLGCYGEVVVVLDAGGLCIIALLYVPGEIRVRRLVHAGRESSL